MPNNNPFIDNYEFELTSFVYFLLNISQNKIFYIMKLYFGSPTRGILSFFNDNSIGNVSLRDGLSLKPWVWLFLWLKLTPKQSVQVEYDIWFIY